MTPNLLLLLLLLLQTKHLLADWVWQTNWMFLNKGTWGHPGGIAHAGLHGLLTLPVLVFAGLGLWATLLVAAVEAISHYHIDWFKARHSSRMKQSPSDKLFWVWMGVDQFAHQLTYIAILFYVSHVI